MSDMIEKMARAMVANNRHSWDAIGDASKASYRRAAHAALTALLEPDDAMVIAGREVTGDGDVAGGVIYNTENEARATFCAMIQAALASQEA